MGSTAIVLLPAGAAKLDVLAPDYPVRVGQAIGHLASTVAPPGR
jgi:hypothetical protein